MKVAIVHDWFVWSGGAERVVEALLELYPEADLFSLVDFYPESQRRRFLFGKKATTTFIQKLPGAKKHFRNYLPLFPLAIEQLDLRGYDLVISSSHAVAKGVKTFPGQAHLCYCYTPMRYAWDQEEEYFEGHAVLGLKKWFLKYVFHRIRIWDVVSSHRVDRFVAISHLVGERIRRYYGRDSLLLYPPVDIHRFRLHRDKDNFYLTASRLVPYKKVRMIVKAFARNGRRLLVVGEGPELETLQQIATENVSILGYCEEEKLINLMQRARGFVYAAYEDFGIVPVEAMACGTPVIAYGAGGVLDTVVEGETGVFFPEQTPESLNRALDLFEAMDFDPERISAHAQRFGRDNFKKAFEETIDSSIPSTRK
ncbi:glycosyltransferase [Thermococcus sp.]|uniref:glycosyltransferase n=1 Tax=Thermococcus sp. TaxID=35749 RepID=UPI0026089202|nr:glycosyltransferase [Thermococcus sp.]